VRLFAFVTGDDIQATGACWFVVLSGVVVMSYLKAKLSLPIVRYGLVTLGSGAWVFGLIEQLHSSSATMNYLLISLLIGAVAVL
jgi:hypothetical protein